MNYLTWLGKKHAMAWCVAGVASFAAFMILGITGTLPVPTVAIAWDNGDVPASPSYVPGYSRVSGREVVLVFIGSSTCAFANDETLPPFVEQAKISLSQKADQLGYSFSVIGVAIDWSASDGVRYLNKFGLFDEVLTGRQ